MNASPTEIECLLFHMPAVARFTDGEWAKNFARSIIRQSKRRNWKPSAKQLSVMQELVEDLFRSKSSDGDNIDVLEAPTE